MEFSEKVRKLLAKRRSSQRELAKAIGTSQPMVSEWLQTNRPPKPSFLLPMARFLGVTCDYLLDDSLEAPQDVQLPEDERAVLQVYRDLRLERATAVRMLALGARDAAKEGEPLHDVQVKAVESPGRKALPVSRKERG